MVQRNKKTIKSISMHDFLMKNSPWYSKWHKDPNHGVYHFLALVAVGVILVVGIVAAINKNVQVSLETSSAATQSSLKNQTDLLGADNNLIKAIKDYEKASPDQQAAALANLTSVAVNRHQAMIAAEIGRAHV